jgi:hypothetical protein
VLEPEFTSTSAADQFAGSVTEVPEPPWTAVSASSRFPSTGIDGGPAVDGIVIVRDALLFPETSPTF